MGESTFLVIIDLCFCVYNLNMKQLEKTLRKIDGYLLSIERNVVEGWYELTVGIPANWAYKSNDTIECETINETEKGDLVKIIPKDKDVVIDDLIEFVNIIIDTNKKIADLQKKLEDELKQRKMDMEEFTAKFLEDIENIKESSFEEMTKKHKEVGKLKEKKTPEPKEEKTPELKQEKKDEALELLEGKLNR